MKMLLASLTVLLAASAYAKSSNEYFFQPEAGKSALEIQDAMTTATVKTDPATVDAKVNDNDIMLDYGYGLNANTTLGVRTSTGTDEVKVSGVSTKNTGMDDIQLYYKGQSDVWHYGADLALGSKSKAKSRATGGNSIGLFGGGLWSADGWNYGGKLSYDYNLEHSDDSSPAVKTTGGDTLMIAAFGEYNYGSGFAGAELSNSSISDTKVKGGGTAKNAGNMAIKLYGSYDFNETCTGLLSLTDAMVAKVTGMKAYNAMIVMAGVRLNF